MKNTFFFFLILLNTLAFSQNEKKNQIIYIVEDKIITKEKVEEYMQKGLIKGMHNGVTTEKYNELKGTLGDAISAKEFICLFEIYSEEEMTNPKPKNQATKKEITSKSDYISNLNDQFILKVNDKAADFVVEMADRKKIKLSSLKGKVVLLNFWATWCAPCIREFYEMPSKIITPFKNQGVVFIPIAIGENKELVQKKMGYLKEKGIDFNVGFDPNKDIWNQYATGSIPKNIIIDKNGIIRYVSTGYNDKNIENLASEIKKLLKN